MVFVVKQDKPSNSLDMRLFGADRIVPLLDDAANLVEEFHFK